MTNSISILQIYRHNGDARDEEHTCVPTTLLRHFKLKG